MYYTDEMVVEFAALSSPGELPHHVCLCLELKVTDQQVFGYFSSHLQSRCSCEHGVAGLRNARCSVDQVVSVMRSVSVMCGVSLCPERETAYSHNYCILFNGRTFPTFITALQPSNCSRCWRLPECLSARKIGTD